MHPEAVFSDLLIEEVSALANFTEHLAVAAGETIFEEGSTDDALYISLTGRLTASARLPNGNAVQFGEIVAGEIFGEIAFLDGMPRSATVIAHSDCELLRLPRWCFEDLQTLYPGVAGKITRDLARILAARLRRSDNHLVSAVQGSTHNHAVGAPVASS
ncbi:MAG: cyclic nucleotide-binding domain-containing protein [Candidatus Sericytochromatia bacterium]|nr:cyclic nucleotide-binding domain-containing protein [Candidatus Sericytochromatia bacterium]